ncbi:MAG TPA: polyphosphate kinase 1, partial [Polyangia bacterium]
RKLARIKVPESLPRFVPLTTAGDVARAEGTVSPLVLVPLEQLIAANLDDLFHGMEILGWYPFRVTRDMDLSIDDEGEDLLSVVNREVQRRRFGACVRLEIHADIPPRIKRLLLEKLEIEDDDVYEFSGPLGLSALMAIAMLPRPDLRDLPFSPRLPPELTDTPDVFAAIRKGDILLHHPYDSFAPVLDFLRSAAEDPNVLAVKMTLYRAGSNAEAVRALIRAAENGKQVAVSVELKARFDEANNIAWARALEHAGAHVFYGDAVQKIHAKVVLVVRNEGGELRRYLHLSTGNYNATTARIYTDVGLLTCDPQMGDDVSELFNSLSGFSKKSRYRKLLVAPHGLADAILSKIGEQARRAEQGKPARIFAKLNALVDARIIRALYLASMAGVSIDLVIRGICCLRPGQPGVSDNIRVHSIIGRFLEHERVFVFGPPGEDETFLCSADWMPRNLDRRWRPCFPSRRRACGSRSGSTLWRPRSPTTAVPTAWTTRAVTPAVVRPKGRRPIPPRPRSWRARPAGERARDRRQRGPGLRLRPRAAGVDARDDRAARGRLGSTALASPERRQRPRPAVVAAAAADSGRSA